MVNITTIGGFFERRNSTCWAMHAAYILTIVHSTFRFDSDCCAELSCVLAYTLHWPHWIDELQHFDCNHNLSPPAREYHYLVLTFNARPSTDPQTQVRKGWCTSRASLSHWMRLSSTLYHPVSQASPWWVDTQVPRTTAKQLHYPTLCL
jgi:hypothetical protein